MKNKTSLYTLLTCFVIAGLLILTAWGNALAMFISSAVALIGLMIWFRIFNCSTEQWWPAVLTAMVVAVAIVFVSNYF